VPVLAARVRQPVLPATQSDFSTWNLTTQWYAQNIGSAVATAHSRRTPARPSPCPER
jgi:hypothetical protein